MLSKGNVLNEPGNVATSLVRLLRGKRAGAIGRQFGAGKCSSARSAIEKIRREIFGGNKRVKDLREVSTNSQQQN